MCVTSNFDLEVIQGRQFAVATDSALCIMIKLVCALAVATRPHRAAPAGTRPGKRGGRGARGEDRGLKLKGTDRIIYKIHIKSTKTLLLPYYAIIRRRPLAHGTPQHAGSRLNHPIAESAIAGGLHFHRVSPVCFSARVHARARDTVSHLHARDRAPQRAARLSAYPWAAPALQRCKHRARCLAPGLARARREVPDYVREVPDCVRGCARAARGGRASIRCNARGSR
jgi:hypothetical protein